MLCPQKLIVFISFYISLSALRNQANIPGKIRRNAAIFLSVDDKHNVDALHRLDFSTIAVSPPSTMSTISPRDEPQSTRLVSNLSVASSERISADVLFIIFYFGFGHSTRASPAASFVAYLSRMETRISRSDSLYQHI